MSDPKQATTDFGPAVARQARDLVAELQSRRPAETERGDVAFTAMLQALNATSDHCDGLSSSDLRSVLLSLMVTLSCAIVDTDSLESPFGMTTRPPNLTAARLVLLAARTQRAADASRSLTTTRPFVRSQQPARDPSAS